MRAATFLAVLLLAASARADDYYSLGLGRVSPLAEEGFSGVVGPGTALGLEYIHQFSWVIGVGVQGDYMPFGAKTVGIGDATVTKGTARVSATAYSAAGVVRVTPFYDEEFGPYFLGGLGVNSFSLKIKARPNPGFAWGDTGTTEDRTFNSTSSGLTYLLGFGLEKVVTPSGLTVGLESRWHFFAIDHSKYGYEWAKALTILLRCGIRFAG